MKERERVKIGEDEERSERAKFWFGLVWFGGEVWVRSFRAVDSWCDLIYGLVPLTADGPVVY